MRVGLYGGSFNPAHAGHRHVGLMALRRLRLDRLRGTVGELPFRTQQIFVLNRIDGLGYAEVARHLGISQSAVQKHLAMVVRHIAERSRPRR